MMIDGKELWRNGTAILTELPDGRQVLYVLCGGAIMFGRSIVLSEEEKRMIEEWGYDYYADKLATDVAKDPNKFNGRFLLREG